MISKELTTCAKADITAFAMKVANQVLDGEASPLKVWLQVKAAENALDLIKKQIEQLALEEAEREGTKNFMCHGANVQIKESGVRYNFAEVGHKRYNEIIKEQERLKEEQKEIESVMKAHKCEWIETDINTGETYEVLPLARTSKTTLAITFK